MGTAGNSPFSCPVPEKIKALDSDHKMISLNFNLNNENYIIFSWNMSIFDYDISQKYENFINTSIEKLYNNFHLISNEIHSICKSSINQNNSDWQIVNKKKKIYAC